MKDIKIKLASSNPTKWILFLRGMVLVLEDHPVLGAGN